MRFSPWTKTFPIFLTIVLFAQQAIAFTQGEIDQASLVARDIDLVQTISNDVYQGRDNNTAGSLAIQQVLIDELKLISNGLNTAQTGDAAYRQAFVTTTTGTNLVAVIPGTDLASEYVMVGAHYDHLGTAGPDIYNGATDNAAGAAAVIAVGRAIDALPTAPRRSIILALWDAEEDGLAGSLYFAGNPLVPLGNIVAYVNFDIQGANLLPSVRNITFAIGAESGGTTLQAMVTAATGQQTTDARLFSRLFGQERSDHANFIDTIPSVFFSDATGPCYHTPDDDIAAVDLGKLSEESQGAFRLVVDLAETTTPPTLTATVFFAATYEDAVVLGDILNGAIVDLSLFGATEQAILLTERANVQAIIDDGPGLFDAADVLPLAVAALNALNAVATLPCDGFQAPAVPSGSRSTRVALVVVLVAIGYGLLAASRIRSSQSI